MEQFERIYSIDGVSNYSPTGINRINYLINEASAKMYDFTKSYMVLNMGVTQPTYYTDSANTSSNVLPSANVCNPWTFGNNGVFYDSSALCRTLIIENKKCGKYYGESPIQVAKKVASKKNAVSTS